MIYFGVDDLIKSALAEDIGTGDITTISCIPQDKQSRARLIAKESGIICGMDIFKRVFALIDDRITVFSLVQDGTMVEAGSVIAKVEGPACTILSGERVALNILQRMSGIATRTAKAVDQIKDTKAQITDTRKTTPGLRVIEKYAVRTGGGVNHRFSLADGVLVKDNHIRAAGGITPAVKAVRASAPHTLKVEVEVDSLKHIEEAIEAGADIIMLDNMSCEDMAEAVRIIDGRALVEASGNMGDRDLHAVAETGVDLISVGALTHSAKAMDISLRF